MYKPQLSVVRPVGTSPPPKTDKSTSVGAAAQGLNTEIWDSSSFCPTFGQIKRAVSFWCVLSGATEGPQVPQVMRSQD